VDLARLNFRQYRQQTRNKFPKVTQACRPRPQDNDAYLEARQVLLERQVLVSRQKNIELRLREF